MSTSQIKDRQAALDAVNYCLANEGDDFWQWVEENGVSVKEGRPLSNEALRHVYANALLAVGVKVPNRKSGSVYVGDVIMNEEAAAVVCEHYNNEDEAEDFENMCDENGWEDYSPEASSHIFPTALRAVGLSVDDDPQST